MKELRELGWDTLDVILFTGDAYVDHPSFGAAVIGRILEEMGLRVAIVPQPNWRDDLRDFRKLGTPRLFFGVTSGSMDSMVNHYTANKRLRSDDAYTPGGQAGFRPDYAVKVYGKILKSLFPEVPLIIGGIEASLRRFTHYDYWSDGLMPGILTESGADLLVYGMGEKPVREIAGRLKEGAQLRELRDIPQTGYLLRGEGVPVTALWDTQRLHSHDECMADVNRFSENFRVMEEASNMISSPRLVQDSGDAAVVINPPHPPCPLKRWMQSMISPSPVSPIPGTAARGISRPTR